MPSFKVHELQWALYNESSLTTEAQHPPISTVTTAMTSSNIYQLFLSILQSVPDSIRYAHDLYTTYIQNKSVAQMSNLTYMYIHKRDPLQGPHLIGQQKRGEAGLQPFVGIKHKRDLLQGLCPMVQFLKKKDPLQGLYPLVAIKKLSDPLQGLYPLVTIKSISHHLQGLYPLVTIKFISDHSQYLYPLVTLKQFFYHLQRLFSKVTNATYNLQCTPQSVTSNKKIESCHKSFQLSILLITQFILILLNFTPVKFAFIIFILATSASAHDSHQTTAIEKTPFALLLDAHLAQICVPYHMNIKYLFSDITINPYPGTIHLHVSNATEYDLPCILMKTVSLTLDMTTNFFSKDPFGIRIIPRLLKLQCM